MLVRKLLAMALLASAFLAVPQWLSLGAHAAEHPGEHAAGHASHLARALIHGHEHEEGVPDHEHRLLPSPPLRPDPPQDLEAPAIASLEVPGAEPLALFGLQPGSGRTGPGDPSPPRLHLLCTLLI